MFTGIIHSLPQTGHLWLAARIAITPSPRKVSPGPTRAGAGNTQPRRSGRQPIHPPSRLGLQGAAARILPTARCLISIRPCPCEISPMPSPFCATRMTVSVSIILARRGPVTKLRGGCVNRLRITGMLRNKVENSNANRASQKERGPDGLVRSP